MTQVKSKDRVRSLAEVYTNESEVNGMLDLIPFDKKEKILSYKYLEPACGNGNFLVEVLRRKLAYVNEKYADEKLTTYEFYLARGLSTIYGIDICKENVIEARDRLFTEIKLNFDLHKGSYIYSTGFLPLLSYILKKNIILGDTINKANEIKLIDYKVKGKKFIRRTYRLSDLEAGKPKPLKTYSGIYFLNIGIIAKTARQV